MTNLLMSAWNVEEKALRRVCKMSYKNQVKICFTFYLAAENVGDEVSALMWIFWSSNTFSLELNYLELLWLQPISKTTKRFCQITRCVCCFFAGLCVVLILKLYLCVWISDSELKGPWTEMITEFLFFSSSCSLPLSQ